MVVEVAVAALSVDVFALVEVEVASRLIGTPSIVVELAASALSSEVEVVCCLVFVSSRLTGIAGANVGAGAA